MTRPEDWFDVAESLARMRGPPEEGPGGRAPSLVRSTVNKSAGDVKGGVRSASLESPMSPLGILGM
jgi:hypothetical protein